MQTSRITSKYQATVPADVRAALGVGAGDQLRWDVDGGVAKVSKAVPLDREWHAFLSKTLEDEWLSDEDEDGFRDL